jgi:TonB-linked outer membrane protein, SusC/RagA family
MRKKIFLLACLLLVSIGWANAQSRSISGKVVSAEDGEAIIGAAILVKGTTTGTATDINGNFTLNVSSSDRTLVIRFLGMEDQEVAISSQMMITLHPTVSSLDEVIVVAYGTTTKKSFTGSAVVVKQADIEKHQASNITSTLAGQVSGVQGLGSNGAPGSVTNIRIRGVGSIRAGNNPLYIVDGIPFDGDMSSLNNSDVESISVLKDAASNALYGARGANGVVMITTRRGKTKDAVINVDAKWGSNRRAVPAYNVMTDPGMYYETYYQALYNGQVQKTNPLSHLEAGKVAYATLFNASNGGLGYNVYTVPAGEKVIGSNGKLNPNAVLGRSDGDFYYKPDDWYKELFDNNNLRQEYNINLSGSTEKLNYYFSAGYLDDTGIISSSGFKRFTSRANAEYQAKKWLKIGANFAYANVKNLYPSNQLDDRSSVNVFYLANMIAPIYPLYIRDAEGTVMKDIRGYTMYDYGDGRISPAVRAWMPNSNPASLIEQDKSVYNDDNISAKWYATVDIYKGLKATANWGLNNYNSRYNYLANPFYGQYVTMGGYAYVSSSRFFSLNQQYLLTYQQMFGAHNVDLLAGVESYELTRSSLSGSQYKLFNPDIPELGNAINSPSTNSYSNHYATLGYLFQAKYDYKSKYYFSASYRRDASSCFHPDNRWGNFWSLGGAWAITEEVFMKDLEFIDYLKLKASYGAQGNDHLLYDDGTRNYYPYQDQSEVSSSDGAFAVISTYKGNEDITWETSHNFNAGIDFGFFNDKLSGTIEYFQRQTSDMLYNMPKAPSFGYSFFPMNVGSMRNSGVEIDLRGNVLKTKDLKVSLFANATFISNKIIKLEESLNGFFADGARMYREGESMYNLYIRNYAGVEEETGLALYYRDTEDENGNTIVKGGTTTNWSQGTQYETGSIMPKVFGGFGASADYLGFDFSIQFAYQLGGQMIDNTYQRLMHSGISSSAGINWHADILNAWTPENTKTDVPRLNALDQYANSTSDRFLTSSNFLSLQNITLGYTLPKQLAKKLYVENIRVYGVADNIAMSSSRRGFDPRQGYVSATATFYSPMKSFSGGVKITF